MSEPLRVGLLGSTGLIGRAVMAEAVGRKELRLLALARREVPLPPGSRMEMVLADTQSWGEVLTGWRPDVVISALGTTWKKAGKDEAEFRRIDYDLVMQCARAAQACGTRRFVTVSSAAADWSSKNLYLRVKGELERDLAKLRFQRLDILQPGLLRGAREDDRRPAELAARIASPLIDPLLLGELRKYRSVRAQDLARSILWLAMDKAQGKFVHDHDSILRAARNIPDATR